MNARQITILPIKVRVGGGNATSRPSKEGAIRPDSTRTHYGKGRSRPTDYVRRGGHCQSDAALKLSRGWLKDMNFCRIR